MIPDVTPNGVFYLPPTGWLTSFYNPPKKISQQIWNKIEELYPKTKSWETCTPYFDQRNIHFYINKLGFHAVEFFNKYHKESGEEETYAGGNLTGMLRFEKEMNNNKN